MLNKLLKAVGVKNPETQAMDPMLTMTVFVVIVCGLKFLFEGVSLVIGEHTFSLGHVDPSAYAALLTPVLGAHSWVAGKQSLNKQEEGTEK